MLVLLSAETAIQPGFSGPVLDAGSALALAQARGVAGDIAAVLIGAAAEGIMQGAAERREGNHGG